MNERETLFFILGLLEAGSNREPMDAKLKNDIIDRIKETVRSSEITKLPFERIHTNITC